MSTADVTLKVLIRCRPFSENDQLGVFISDRPGEKSEIELVNGEHGSRYAFQYSWWSAFGYEKHMQPDDNGYATQAKSIPLVSQEDIYKSIGNKMLDLILSGQVVVLFAYGLSGSGKTYTVFGPDMTSDPAAWYKSMEPQSNWGLFPRIAYNVFKMSKPGWKISIKYFQNVVDTVRDLLSPQTTEKFYKEGMHKDASGFVDIRWCRSEVVETWADLIRKLTHANNRKSISPTQFNYSSTRGHCILVFQVDRPHPQDTTVRQSGRMYVSDLAGAEPAGDIVFARYRRVENKDGTVEYTYLGPHPDKSRTKSLQNQGKKINLSLSEMTQFFHKMALGIKRKTLKEGDIIPGCNNFFLGKFLKETLLHGHTYLCAAVRPEVKFERYNMSTLEFAKSASLVKLGPHRLSRKRTPELHTKLLNNMNEMEKKLKILEEQNKALREDDQKDEEEIIRLRKTLMEKEKELRNHVKNEHMKEQEQNCVYLDAHLRSCANAGITLITHPNMEKEFQCPYLINLDDDPYTNKRYAYMLNRPINHFGLGKDIEPIVHQGLVTSFCTIQVRQEDCTKEGSCGPKVTTLHLTALEGQLFHNGTKMFQNETHPIVSWDRIVFGGEIMMLVLPGEISTNKKIMLPAEAYDEYASAVANAHKNRDTNSQNEIIEKEVEADYINNSVNNLEPLIDTGNTYCKLLNRGEIVFSIALEAQIVPSQLVYVKDATNSGKTKKTHILVAVKATNTRTNHYAMIDIDCFKSSLGVLAIEIRNLKLAIEDGRIYTVPSLHDPLRLFFDRTFEYGFVTYSYKDILFKKSIGAQSLKIQSLTSPHKNVGTMDVVIINEHETSSIEVGKELLFSLDIKTISSLEIDANKVLCRASFVNHQEFVTDLVGSDENYMFQINSLQHCHIEELSHKNIEDLNTMQLLVVICVNIWNPNTEGEKMISSSAKEIIEIMKCEENIAEANGDEVLLAKRIVDYEEQNKTLSLEHANMKKRWELSIEKMHQEHDNIVSKNEIAVNKLTSDFKRQLERQALDAQAVEHQQQKQIEVLSATVETSNEQHKKRIALIKKEKQPLLDKASVEISSLKNANKDLMQQHLSEIRHLELQHKHELENSIKMQAELTKVREELVEERKRHRIRLKETNDEFLRKRNMYKVDVREKQDKQTQLLNKEFENKLRQGKIRYQNELANNRKQHDREIAEMKRKFDTEKQNMTAHFQDDLQILKQTSQEALEQQNRNSENTKTRLEQQILQLQTQIKEGLSRHDTRIQKLKNHYEDQIDSIRNTNKILEEELHTSTISSHSADEKLIDLTKRSEALRQKISEDSKKKMELRNTLHELECMLENKNSEVKSFVQKCDVLQLEAKTLAVKTSELQNKLSAEIQEKIIIQNELTRHKKYADVAKKSFNDLENKLRKHTNESQARKLDIQELQHNLDLKDNFISHLKADANQLQIENDALKGSEEELKSKLQESKHDILLLKRTIDTEKSRCSELEDNTAMMTNKIELQSQTFTAEKVALEEKFKEVDRKLKMQTLKSEESENGLLETAKRLRENEKTVTKLQESLATSKKQVDRMRDESNKIIAQNKLKQKTLLEQMQQKFRFSEEKRSSLEAKYSDTKLSLERSLVEQSNSNRILKKEVDRLQRIVSELKAKNSALMYKNEQEFILAREREENIVRVNEKLQLSQSKNENDRAEFELKWRKNRESQDALNRKNVGTIQTLRTKISSLKTENSKLQSNNTYSEAKFDKEIKIIKKEMADLQRLRRRESNQKDEDVEKMKSTLDELQQAHELELTERETMYKLERKQMYDRMEELRNEIISTRQTMIDEMNQKIEAERLRLILDHESIIQELKMGYQEKLLDFQSEERKWKVQKTTLQHEISKAKHHAQCIAEAAAREELVLKSRTKALNEKLKAFSEAKDSDKQIKDFLDTASANLADLSKSQLVYEANQERLRKELEKKHFKTLHALHDAEAKLKSKELVDNNEANASSNFDFHISPVYIALKKNYDKVITESKILKSEIARRKTYMDSLANKYRQEKQHNLVELADVSAVLESSQEKWDKERSKLRKSYKQIQESWQETKMELQKERMQNMQQCKKLNAEKRQLESWKKQAEISAVNYKSRFESIVAQSEEEKASWRNMEIELKAKLHAEESRVKHLQHHIQGVAHERDKILNEAREERQQKLQISSAYQSLLRRSVNENSTNGNIGDDGQKSVTNGPLANLKAHVHSEYNYGQNQEILSLNSTNESISNDILQLKEELARLRSIGIDDSENYKGL